LAGILDAVDVTSQVTHPRLQADERVLLTRVDGLPEVSEHIFDLHERRE
jgi:hypothetical protein